MSQLRKYISDPFHVIRPDTIQLKDTITFDAMFIWLWARRSRNWEI